MRTITWSQAMNEAIAEEMRRDERVFILGEDVAEAHLTSKVWSSLPYAQKRSFFSSYETPMLVGWCLGFELRLATRQGTGGEP